MTARAPAASRGKWCMRNTGLSTSPVLLMNSARKNWVSGSAGRRVGWVGVGDGQVQSAAAAGMKPRAGGW